MIRARRLVHASKQGRRRDDTEPRAARADPVVGRRLRTVRARHRSRCDRRRRHDAGGRAGDLVRRERCLRASRPRVHRQAVRGARVAPRHATDARCVLAARARAPDRTALGRNTAGHDPSSRRSPWVPRPVPRIRTCRDGPRGERWRCPVRRSGSCKGICFADVVRGATRGLRVGCHQGRSAVPAARPSSRRHGARASLWRWPAADVKLPRIQRHSRARP